jgi:hypothetical protein
VDDFERVSPAAAGCMFLTWLQPTDRALAGWSPWPAEPSGHSSSLVRWFADQVRMNLAERTDHALPPP